MEKRRNHQPAEEPPRKKHRRYVVYSSSDEEIIEEPPIPREAPPIPREEPRAASSRSTASSSRVRQISPHYSRTNRATSSRVRQSPVRSHSPRRPASPPARQTDRRVVTSPEITIHRDASPVSAPPSPVAPPRGASLDPVNIDTEKLPEVSDDTELEEEILQLLGDAPKVDTNLGPAIHKDIAGRWQDILAKGLPKEVKDKLLEEYAIPSNCDLLQAPALNPEAKAALTETMVRRDTSLLHKQKQLGVALAALSKCMELVISNETSKKKLIKPLSDACRIICDNHYVENKTRRSLVLSNINTSLKETLLEAPRDGKFLFGENVGEKLKAAKTIQRSGEVLKQPQKFTKSNFAVRQNKSRPNFKPVHRKTDNKLTYNADVNDTRAARAPHRGARSSGMQRQNYRDRSPAPQTTSRRNYRR